MTRYDSMMLFFKAKYQTRVFMRRHRIWTVAHITTYPESELRALWGDR